VNRTAIIQRTACTLFFLVLLLPIFAQDVIICNPKPVLLVSPDSTSTIGNFEQDSVFFGIEDSVSPEIPFLTRWLRFFVKGFDVTELIEEDFEYAPIFEGADSVYQERLKNINTLIDLPYNARVRSYIEVYTVRKRNQTRAMLELSKYYFPIFEQALAKHGLPEELKFLPIIESALNPHAVSRVGASGPWQFMYRTGKAHGLRITGELDERFDPEKASEAAAVYLKSLHNRFGCWTLAIAAYNGGQGNVNRAITRAKGKRNFWEIYNFLPRETRNYVPAFIGATYAMTYHREHGIFPSDDFPEISDTLMVRQKVYFSQIAQFTGVSVQTIRDYNPQYKSGFIPKDREPLVLILPANYIQKFIAYSDTIFTHPVFENNTGLPAENQATRITYRVKRGDTLSSIQRKHPGSTVQDIINFNNLRDNGNKIYPNQVLKIRVN
jgi:membrane-bound lytic murein transglycosylase D